MIASKSFLKGSVFPGTAADQSMQHNKHPNKTEDDIRDFSENSSASGELHINPIAIPIYAV
uniref:Uncharacterized protein n=1 Tax=Human betaherpesvirus 6A TaxID=32603 RepID=A0A2L2QAS2_9BETA|nr:hypothetical protein [Human betaherpesvirus 6A]AVI07647.1 hypothetical protein [Human betaherpesvirus 6A]AVI07768.1 hypothetical protein [Human betaherpesvirus 6A]AVI08015.1 hypothetical protein [Human betaherpesvirus 6A]AVI08141.1 hypothetical protein [Human betaherpesvirus 6A]